jgi:hypothetical protein
MAKRLRIPLRSMPNLSPAPFLFSSLHTLREGPYLLRDRCFIALRFRIAQAAPAGGASFTFRFLPILQYSCYCGWSAIPLRSMTNQPQALVSFKSCFSFRDGGCLIRSPCSIAFRNRSLIRNPPLMFEIHLFFDKNLLLNNPVSVLPCPVFRGMYLHTFSFNF